MKKTELKKMRSLPATNKMMKLAAEDKLTPKKYYNTEYKSYERDGYIRCHNENGILKVAFFLTEHMRLGGRNPIYELFIDRDKEQFITYDCLENNWLSAKLDMIQGRNGLYFGMKYWISTSDKNVIKKYFKGGTGDYKALLDFQRQVRENQLLEKHRKETDPWDADLERTPELPKDWQRWVNKVGIQQNYIYYQYSKKGADIGYCTFCDKDVPIKQPRHNAVGKCSCCRHTVTFKSIGRAGTVETDRNSMYLIQRCKEGVIVREFMGCRKYLKGEYKTPECSSWEIRRAIYDENALNPRAYYMGMYKQREHRWIKCGSCSLGWSGNEDGKVYGKTLPSLSKNELQKTGLWEASKGLKILDPEKYLAVLHEIPQLEKIAKAKLPAMIAECISKYDDFQKSIHSPKAKSLTEILGINAQELKRLRKNNAGLKFLDWLRCEKSTGKPISDHIISWFCAEKITTEELQFILGKMSPLQIHNYLKRQMSANKKSSQAIITTWSDYLSMAKRLKMDTNDEIIYRVNKLFQRHDELVERCHEKEVALQADEVSQKYPHIDDICVSIKEKYEYADDDYAVVVPSCIEEIIFEGRELHHCVATSERYWERIERRETYVLFLRKTSDIEKAHYTLEIEPTGTVRQKRTMYDRQEPDIEDATKFLAKWQKIISKRITEKDKKLAEKSRVRRVEEYAQLREDKVIIHTGNLSGKLLVDVLLADLMETAA